MPRTRHAARTRAPSPEAADDAATTVPVDEAPVPGADPRVELPPPTTGVRPPVYTVDDEGRARLVEAVRRAWRDKRVELELRVGEVRNGRFTPGVTRDHMDRVVKTLEATDRARARGVSWLECEDYFFAPPPAVAETTAARRLRTRVHFDAGQMSVRSETIHKVRVDQFVLRTHAFDVRVAVHEEVPVALPVALAVRTDHVRIKQTRTFDLTHSPFRIDCSMVWSGATRSEAEKRQQREDGLFEIELEFAPHDDEAAGRTVDWRARYGARDEAAACDRLVGSLLSKATDLIMTSRAHFAFYE